MMTHVPERSASFGVPDGVRWRRIGDETVILHLESEHYFGLQGVGTRLWELLADGVPFGSAVDHISEAYEVPKARVEQDCGVVLSDLLDHGLVILSTAGEDR